MIIASVLPNLSINSYAFQMQLPRVPYKYLRNTLVVLIIIYDTIFQMLITAAISP